MFLQLGLLVVSSPLGHRTHRDRQAAYGQDLRAQLCQQL